MEGFNFNTRGPTTYTTEVGSNDIMFGRGAPVNQNEGNVRLRAIVQSKRTDYVASRKHEEKNLIAVEIVQIVLKRGGRFLREIESPEEARRLGVPAGANAWAVVDDTTIFRKVKQLLRETGKRSEAGKKNAEGGDKTGSDGKILKASPKKRSRNVSSSAGSPEKKAKRKSSSPEKNTKPATATPEKKDSAGSVSPSPFSSFRNDSMLLHGQGSPMVASAGVNCVDGPSSTKQTDLMNNLFPVLSQQQMYSLDGSEWSKVNSPQVQRLSASMQSTAFEEAQQRILNAYLIGQRNLLNDQRQLQPIYQGMSLDSMPFRSREMEQRNMFRDERFNDQIPTFEDMQRAQRQILGFPTDFASFKFMENQPFFRDETSYGK